MPRQGIYKCTWEVVLAVDWCQLAVRWQIITPGVQNQRTQSSPRAWWVPGFHPLSLTQHHGEESWILVDTSCIQSGSRTAGLFLARFMSSFSGLGWLLSQNIYVNVILKQISMHFRVGSGGQLDSLLPSTRTWHPQLDATYIQRTLLQLGGLLSFQRPTHSSADCKLCSK